MGPIAAIDSHAHLDDAAFDADRAAVVAAANEAGVRQIVNVGYNPERWRTTIALTRRWPNVFAMFGLHPHDAALWSPELRDELATMLDTEPAAAIGEIGLDYFRNKAAPAIQREAFAAQLDLARRRDLPIVIHQRAAEADLIDVLQGYVDLPPVVLHSFDGTARLSRFAQARDYYAGVGGLATRPANESLRAILATFPLSSIVLETDAPNLTPAGVRARRNEPAFLIATANRLASLWQVEPATLLAASGETTRQLFRLPQPAAAGGARS
ncbi:MAG TPA: TatD family hydrolase [Thermomicrobiales bacterium]|nr:TatD family hydrolase [Thermomicrobiales bacterium]